MKESIDFLRWVRDCKIRPFLLDSWVIDVPNGEQVCICTTTDELYDFYIKGYSRINLLNILIL